MDSIASPKVLAEGKRVGVRSWVRGTSRVKGYAGASGWD